MDTPHARCARTISVALAGRLNRAIMAPRPWGGGAHLPMGFMESGDPAEPLRAGMEAGAGVWRNKRLCASFLSLPVPSCSLRHRSAALTTSEWWFCDFDFRSRITKPNQKKRDRKTQSCSFQTEEATIDKNQKCVFLSSAFSRAVTFT